VVLTAARAIAVSAGAIAVAFGMGAGPAVAATAPPQVRLSTLATGLAIPWDLALLPDGTVLFTQRGGVTTLRRADGSLQRVATDQADLFVGSEAGLMGLALDPEFASNRLYYTCQAYRGSGTAPVDIRVLRWRLSADNTAAARIGAPVVTGIPITTGQHAGCRLRFAPDGTLHIGTGDAITGTTPQDLSSLGGKTLRVRPDGSAPADNPFSAMGGNAAKVFTYGHRNVQGLAVRPGTSQVWSAEHGPDVDDEVNLLARGANYGWDPVPGYNQNVQMTDLGKFPSAVAARWRSGDPTVATSGATFLTGRSWGRWLGPPAGAVLKNPALRVLPLPPDGRVTAAEEMGPLDGTLGRIRTVQSGAGGVVYGTTSNGSDDRLFRVDPVATPEPYRVGLDVSPSGVAALTRGSQVTAFVRGTDDQVWYASQSVPGGGWAGWRKVPGVVASAPTVVSWDGSRIDLFARGTNRHLLHTYTTGAGYHPWEDLGGVLSAAPAAASLTPGTLDILVRGSDDTVWRKRWAPGWTSWQPVGGIISSAPAVAADAGSDLLTVYARGRDANLWDEQLTASGVRRGWHRNVRQTWSAAATTPGNTPTLVTRNGRTPVVTQGSFATAIGGLLSGAPAVTARDSTSYLVLGRGTDNALWAYDGRPGHYRWSRVGGALR
jgi:glucose/arabinose dehydrogenase